MLLCSLHPRLDMRSFHALSWTLNPNTLNPKRKESIASVADSLQSIESDPWGNSDSLRQWLSKVGPVAYYVLVF